MSKQWRAKFYDESGRKIQEISDRDTKKMKKKIDDLFGKIN